MAAQQPVLYTVQESMNLLSLDNQVSSLSVHFLKLSTLVYDSAAFTLSLVLLLLGYGV